MAKAIKKKSNTSTTKKSTRGRKKTVGAKKPAKKTVKKTVKKTTKKAVAKKAPAKKKPVKKTATRKKAATKKSTKKTTRKSTKAKKEEYLEALDDNIAVDSIDTEEEEAPQEKKTSAPSKTMLEQILFKIPCVPDPLIGTPKQVQKELDGLAKHLQKDPNDNHAFDKIHLYMHGYLINVVLKKFPYIRGFQTVDIYQETLIALRFKAISNFKKNKGMSFLNFAKMCIRRHLITLLNASKNRKKDQSMNQAISLDSSPIKDDDRNSFSNIVQDHKERGDEQIERQEAIDVTKNSLLSCLSEFEQTVLKFHLTSASYEEIAKEISALYKKRYNTKSVDNALLRIRKKAMHLKAHGKLDDMPIFI